MIAQSSNSKTEQFKKQNSEPPQRGNSKNRTESHFKGAIQKTEQRATSKGQFKKQNREPLQSGNSKNRTASHFKAAIQKTEQRATSKGQFKKQNREPLQSGNSKNRTESHLKSGNSKNIYRQPAQNVNLTDQGLPAQWQVKNEIEAASSKLQLQNISGHPAQPAQLSVDLKKKPKIVVPNVKLAKPKEEFRKI